MLARMKFRIALGLALLVLGAADLSGATQEAVSIDEAFCKGSPCSQPVELVPGTPTYVNLRGERLGQLRWGVLVDTSGKRYGEGRVGLARPTHQGTRRPVKLTVQAPAPAATGLRLRFRRKDAGGTVSAPFEMSVAAQAQMVITKVTTELTPPPDNNYYFWVTVENRGPAAGAAEWRVRESVESSTATPCTSITPGFVGLYLGTLQPGESKSVWTQAKDESLHEVGTHQCTFALSPGSSEPIDPATKFEYTFTVPPPPPPDLTIAGVETDPAQPRMAKLYTLRVRVGNLGPGVFESASFKWRVVATCTADTYHSFPFFNMLPGYGIDAELSVMPVLTVVGQHSCTFRVESDGPEADESNNEFTYTWSVTP